MSYQDIDNLYKNKAILLFKECYALEKIHGTSAHVGWRVIEPKDGSPITEGEGEGTSVYYTRTKVINFFSGGAKYDAFVSLFDQDKLQSQLVESGIKAITFFGEAYGGHVMKMKAVYGDTLKFVVFEVKIGDYWLSVPKAEELARQFGFDFVPYSRIPTTLESLDSIMAAPSAQAMKLGMGNNHKREGVVLHPLEEMTCNGGRVIAKHKNPEFAEVKSPRPLDQDKLKLLDDAKAISDEWVTEMRLTHVLDGIHLAEPYDITRTGDVIRAMLEDIAKEAKGEVTMSIDAKKAVSQTTARMFKQRISQIKEGEATAE